MKSERKPRRSYERGDSVEGRSGTVPFLWGFGAASLLWWLLYLALAWKSDGTPVPPTETVTETAQPNAGRAPDLSDRRSPDASAPAPITDGQAPVGPSPEKPREEATELTLEKRSRERLMNRIKILEERIQAYRKDGTRTKEQIARMERSLERIRQRLQNFDAP